MGEGQVRKAGEGGDGDTAPNCLRCAKSEVGGGHRRYGAAGLVIIWRTSVLRSLDITGTTTGLLLTGLLTTGVFGIIKTLGSVVYILFLVESLGRRRLLMIGSTGGALATFYIAGYVAVAKPSTVAGSGLSGGGISALVTFYVSTAAYGPTWNPTPWVLNAEIFPQECRTVAQACGAASKWLWNFAITQGTPHMFAAWGSGVYLFFASLMVLSILYVFLLVRETACVPLEEIDNLFSKRPKWRAHALLMDELRVQAGEREIETTHGDEEKR